MNVNLKNPDLDLRRRIHPENHGFMIRFRICPPSGFDEEFVYEVEDDFLCLICQLALKEPVPTRCGHRFSNACLDEHLRRYTH